MRDFQWENKDGKTYQVWEVDFVNAQDFEYYIDLIKKSDLFERGIIQDADK